MADLGSILGSAGIGGAIGKAIVSLELDTKKYQAELKAAEGQTIASTNKSSAAFGSFSGFASKALLGVGVAAVAGAAVSVKAAVEANEAHLKLQNTFENNALLADSSVAAFEAQADALRDLTGVDDEAIIGAQALLGQFKLTGDQVTELIPLIVDLSAKMGIDLDAAAKAVGKATQGSSGALARYGIAVDVTGSKVDAYESVLQGLGVAQGFAADRADAEPWRVLGAQFEEVSEQIGQALLPVLQSVADFAQSTFIPILEKMADNLGLTLAAATGFVVWIKYQSIVAAFGRVIASFTLIMDSLTVSTIAATTAIGSLIKLLPLAGLGMGGYKEATDEELPILKEFHDAQRSANLELETSKQKADLAAAGIYNLTGAHEEAVAPIEAVTLALRKELDATLALADPTFALINATRDMEEARHDLAVANNEVTRLEEAGKEGTKAYAEALQEQEDAALAAAEAQVGVASATRALQQAINDGDASLKEINQDLTAIGKAAGLSGDQIQGLKNDVRSGLSVAAALAAQLAPEVGRNLVHGIALGITTGSELVSVAAAQAVHDAIAAANRAADTHSPSKLMHKLGLDMMEGLYQGITKGAQKVIDAATASTEKLIDKFSSQLDKVKGMASEFAGSISGGIGGFGDIGGAFGEGEVPIQAVLAQQVGGAQQLADILRELKRQGASRALLSEVAETGAAFGQVILDSGVGEANQAIQDIASLAKQTGKGLSEQFFGDKVDKLDAKLEKQNDHLRELVELERLGHTHAIILDGQKVSESVRNELIKTGKRNPGAGIP